MGVTITLWKYTYKYFHPIQTIQVLDAEEFLKCQSSILFDVLFAMLSFRGLPR